MECCCYLRTVQDLLTDKKTLHERRFGEPFKGPIIPFGQMVEYHPISAKVQSRLHQFGKKVLPGIFLGYALFADVELGKKMFWSQTFEELENQDASELQSGPVVKNHTLLKTAEHQCNTENSLSICVPRRSTRSSSSTTNTCRSSERSEDENKDIDLVLGNRLQDLPEWLEISVKIKWTKECQHHGTHTQALLVKQIRNLQENWIRVGTVYSLTEKPKLRSMQKDQHY